MQEESRPAGSLAAMQKLILIVLLSPCAFAQERLIFLAEDSAGKNIVELGSGALTQGPLWNLYPDISSDGKTLCFVRGKEKFKLVVRQGEQESMVSLDSDKVFHPRMSGDGRFLAFSAQRGGRHQIGIVKLADLPSPPVRWIESAGDAYFPDLSSDGSWLVYQENRAKAKVIVRRALSGDQVQDLTHGEGVSTCPSFSFDDRHIVYSSLVEGNWDVYQRDLAQGQAVRKTTHPAKDLAPAFGRDGQVVFASDRDGPFALFQGSDPSPTRLTQVATSSYAPRLSGRNDLLQAQLPPIPGPPRSSFGVVATAEGVYVCGGHSGSEHTYPPESFCDRLDFYNVAEGRWQSLPPRPRPAHGFSLFEHQGYIYALGGFCYSAEHKPAWRSLSEIDRYDPKTRTWTTVGQLPRRRSSYAAAQLDGKFYLFGGWDSTPTSPGNKEGLFHPEIDVFDANTQRSITLPTRLPDPLRRAFSAVVRGNEVLLVGGLGQGASHFELLDKVTSFDTKTQEWRELQPLPFPTFAPAAGLLGSQLFVFGGMLKTGPRDYQYVNHIFELSADKWIHSGRYLSENKGFAQVVTLPDGSLGILGGHHYASDNTDSPVDTFETLTTIRRP